MSRFKKALWLGLGFILLGIAYIGIVTPGIPWSTPTVGAAFCFAKSNKQWHNWIMNHPLFGPFLSNWSEKRIFPMYGKIAMFITMDISLIVLWFSTYNWKLVSCIGIGMAICMAWAFKYPSSTEEYEIRKANGKKIGWFK
jgi:uncharacterized membrane protein YbaN (DUF454 family)